MITEENIFTEYPEIVSFKQLMEMLHIGRSRATALLKNGEIMSIRIGRTHKIPKICIINYINAKASQN